MPSEIKGNGYQFFFWGGGGRAGRGREVNDVHCGLGENGECSHFIIFVIIGPHASFQGKRSFEFYRRNQGTKHLFA